MNNNIQKTPSLKAKPSPHPLSVHKEKCSEEESTLLTELSKIGYGNTSIETFVTMTPDLNKGQAESSYFIQLQERCRNHLKTKKALQKTILLEPSKLPETVDAAERIIRNHDSKEIFQRSGKLVRLSKISTLPKNKALKVRRPHDAIVIKEIDQAFFTVFLTKIAHFVQLDGRSKGLKKIDCPEKIARYLLAKGEWNLPVLTGIINAPTLRSDGSILDTPGYDPASGLLFITENYSFEKIPEAPTREEAIETLNELLSFLDEFPFENEISRSVAVAAILTALVRKSIATAPLFGFTAPKMGSGKSLLADIVSLIATGKTNSVIAQSENETEEKKRMLALLLEGDPIICYDNIERPFGNAALCAILTQSEYKDRILGSTETSTVPTNATFLATGNNLTFTGDTSTRTLLCKLDPNVERPEERSFKLNLHEEIPKNRERLVCACLTILRAYYVAGKPEQPVKPFGRFEDWSNTIRSSLIWVGMADPCESRKDIENSDPVRILLGSLFSSWYAMFESRPVKIKEILGKISEQNENEDRDLLKESIHELAADYKGVINIRSLARKLASYKGRIENGYRLENAGPSQGTTQWRIRKVDEQS